MQLPSPPTPCRTADLPEALVLRALAAEAAMTPRARLDIAGIGHRLCDLGWPWKVVLGRLERMERKRLIDCGTSIATPWLTEKGQQVARAIAATGSVA
jgi:hypothetical protein